MQNLCLQEHFQNDKSRFFQQKTFDGDGRLKKWGYLCSIVILVYEILQTLVLLPTEVRYARVHTTIISIILFGIAFLSYYISIFKFFEKMTKKIFIVRCILIWICVLCFSIALALKGYDEILDRVRHNSVEKWFYSLIKSRNEVWIILLMDTLIPIWYVKLIVPLSYWIAQILAFYTVGLEYKAMVLGCFAFSISIITLLWGIRTYHEWKVFIRKLNVEAWDDIHQYILDKVPDAIALIDANSQVIYSNLTFKTLCQDNLTNLSQKLTFCKKSGTSIIADSEYINEDIKSLHNPYNKSESGPYTLIEILQKNIKPLIKGQYKLDNYLNFSAEMLGTPENEQMSRSYEIKLGSLLKYSKVILILSDTTQRDRATSLETANQYKDKLLATVSHDLRAPINGSMNLLESSIEHEAVPDFIKEQFLIPAQRSCKLLLHLVNDILDFSQINAQKLRMNFETSSLIETIRNCYQLLEMQANKKRIDFNLILAKNLPEMFTTDHNRLSQVILNLLTNAVKFTFAGSVTLSAHVENSQVHIKVIDTGIGIQDKDKEKLFQEFTQIKYEQHNMNTTGVGLGLVIANNLATRLGPTQQRKGISFSSVYGKGSTFEFMLEDKKYAEEDMKKENSLTKTKIDINLCLTSLTYREEDFLFQKMDEGDLPRNKSRYSSVVGSSFNRGHLMSCEGSIQVNSPISPKKRQFSGRVLVVDDDAINVIAFETILKQYGIRVDAAYNGKEAINKILENHNHNNFLRPDDYEKTSETPNQQSVPKEYQLIFMDYEMPIMNGIQTTKVLKDIMQNKQISLIPIIGCTGYQDNQIQEECFESGMSDLVTKPPVKEKLLEILEKYLNMESPESSCASPYSL
jgi:signal transduction histidine kinase/CheY-like chemotaxis protein